MRPKHTSSIVFGLSLLVAALPLSAQNGSRPNVFFDCEGRDCNSQYYRTEITWVNWVNDPLVSDVHVIMSSLTTGAGGRQFQLDFLGIDEEVGYEDRLLFQTLPTDTDRERLDGIAHTLGIGLARFANEVGFRGIVSLQGPDPESSPAGGLVSRAEVDDPWNLWVFRINGSGTLTDEETRGTKTGFGSLNVSRVSPTWKLNFNSRINYSQQRRETTDTTTLREQHTDWSFNPLIAYAIADHWSVGLSGQLARSTNLNQDFRAEITPGLEYSFFSYEEATRHALTAYYKIGPAYQNYILETVYAETSETRWTQSLELEFSQRQRWGDAGVTITGSHYLHDFDRHNLSLEGDIDYRIVRGISVNARANVSFIDDQIHISAEGVSPEEALLDLRDRQTARRYRVTIGFSIQFGSIFNNVVNNRFRGVGVGGFGGFPGRGGGRR